GDVDRVHRGRNSEMAFQDGTSRSPQDDNGRDRQQATSEPAPRSRAQGLANFLRGMKDVLTSLAGIATALTSLGIGVVIGNKTAPEPRPPAATPPSVNQPSASTTQPSIIPSNTTDPTSSTSATSAVTALASLTSVSGAFTSQNTNPSLGG